MTVIKLACPFFSTAQYINGSPIGMISSKYEEKLEILRIIEIKGREVAPEVILVDAT